MDIAFLVQSFEKELLLTELMLGFIINLFSALLSFNALLNALNIDKQIVVQVLKYTCNTCKLNIAYNDAVVSGWSDRRLRVGLRALQCGTLAKISAFS